MGKIGRFRSIRCRIKIGSMHITLCMLFCVRTLAQVHKEDGPQSFLVRSAIVEIHFDKRYSGDTVFSQFFPTVGDDGDFPISAMNFGLPRRETTKIIDREGVVKIKIDNIDEYGYFSFSKDYIDNVRMNSTYVPFLDLGLIGSGDNIRITIKSDEIYPSQIKDIHDSRRRKYSLEFEGKGSDKLQLYYNLYNGDLDKLVTPGDPDVPEFNKTGFLDSNSTHQKRLEYLLKYADKYKGRIEKKALEIYKADLIGAYLTRINYPISKYPQNSKERQNAASSVENFITNISTKIPQYAKDFSKYYTSGIYNLEKAIYKSKYGALSGDFYNRLKAIYSGKVRDKLLTRFILSANSQIPQQDSLLIDGVVNIQDQHYKKKAKQATAKLPGVAVYDFSLPDVNDKTISMSDLKGKVVFLDFYFNGCGACAIYYENTLKKVEEAYKENKNVVFIAISVDATKKIWTNGMKKGEYTHEGQENVLNLYTAGRGVEHPLIQYYNIQGYPTFVLINKEGNILEFDGGLRTGEKYLKESITQALEQPSLTSK